MISLWITAFAWTLALEQPIYTLWLRNHVRHWWTPCAITLVANAASHPAYWFVFPRFDPYWQYVLAGEACVVLVETVVVAVALGRRRLGRAFATSLTANLVSTLVGLAIMGTVST